MPHGDPNTPTGVTAAALARVELLRDYATEVSVDLGFHPQFRAGVERADVPFLAAIALAGLALRREIEEQWGPGGDALAAYDAAIRAAGEAGQ